MANGKKGKGLVKKENCQEVKEILKEKNKCEAKKNYGEKYDNTIKSLCCEHCKNVEEEKPYKRTKRGK